VDVGPDPRPRLRREGDLIVKILAVWAAVR
jgi:hypothetical protein